MIPGFLQFEFTHTENIGFPYGHNGLFRLLFGIYLSDYNKNYLVIQKKIKQNK